MCLEQEVLMETFLTSHLFLCSYWYKVYEVCVCVCVHTCALCAHVCIRVVCLYSVHTD